ncbi:MAG: type IV toxin-antitoxin system AbiEi family antitoxin [Actinomycetia bacterium]|nr:type IV toxin-antitoxin system AbiEi family antitoxin [Actinomycetes bacterium]
MDTTTEERVRAVQLVDWLLARGRSSITTSEIAAVLGIPQDQVRRRLHAPASRGEWVSPARGLWIPVPAQFRLWGAPEGIEIIDAMMAHLGAGYYVGWLTAAEIHGAAHQAPQVFQVATDRAVQDRQVGRTRFTFATRTALRHIPTVAHPTRAGTAMVSTREATMLDIAADISLAGGIDNAATVLIELAEDSRDADALAAAAAHHCAAALRRAGWVLDRLGGLDTDTLHQLADKHDAAPSLLDPTGPTTGHIDQHWQLRINRDVQEES